MHIVAEELNRKLNELDRPTAELVEKLVRDALSLALAHGGVAARSWPEGYFEKTAGALAGERLERPEQGTIPIREAW